MPSCLFAFVSIHASSREDATTATDAWTSTSSFNPRVLAGGRDVQALQSPDFYMFQSTRPRGRTRQRLLTDTRHPACFNPRVLAGGRDIIFNHANYRAEFQSTRPRGRTRPVTIGGDTWTIAGFNPRVLAGGRDKHLRVCYWLMECFNPRVLAGGRDNIGCCRIRKDKFQSTRPRGRTRPLLR